MTAGRPLTRRVLLETVDSTNREAERLFRNGETGPLLIAAREQTAGRGRSGRDWVSKPGNLFTSYLFRFDGPPASAPQLGFVAAIAVCDTLEELAPGHAVTLKWPNDCLLDGKKVAGLLLENFGPALGKGSGVVIGMGINLAHAPSGDQTRWPATSVLTETGTSPDLEIALELLTTTLEKWLERFAAEGFPTVRAAWCDRAAHLGEQVTVQTPQGPVTGRFENLGGDGALVLQTPEGSRQIAVGDVTFGEVHHASGH